MTDEIKNRASRCGVPYFVLSERLLVDALKKIGIIVESLENIITFVIAFS